MIVAGLQIDIAWETPEENFIRAERLTPPAVAAGARLIVLPEMFATGFSMNTAVVSGHAETTRTFLADLARRHSVWVLGGVAEEGSGRPGNAALLYDPAGALACRYRKIHPFTLAGEDRHYQAGETIETGEVEGLRVTPLICYDLRFPELFRIAAASTDLFCVIASWPTPRADAWRTLLRARAIENLSYVLGVNRVGSDPDGHDYAGDSGLFDPLGRPLVTARQDATVILGSIDREEVGRQRRALGFLADRRSDLYGELSRSAAAGRDRRRR